MSISVQIKLLQCWTIINHLYKYKYDVFIYLVSNCKDAFCVSAKQTIFTALTHATLFLPVRDLFLLLLHQFLCPAKYKLFNPLKPSGNYMSCLLYTVSNSSFSSYVFVWSHNKAIRSLNSVNRLIFVTVNCGAFSAVRTEFLYITQTSFGSRG
jgi:hypothetical protein